MCDGRPRSSVRRSSLLTFVLQGVYQSHQATASACAANNINLLRGMIGRPGRGDPADERPADRAEHARDGLQRRPARLSATGKTRRTSPSWRGSGTSSRMQIPHWGPPTHAMEIFRYAEQGSIEFLWVSGTNPAVSLPELRPDPVDPLAGEPLPRRLGRVPDRDCAAGRCRPARRALGREDGHVHEHRPHRAPLRASGRAARRGAQRHGDLPRLRAPARPAGQGRAAARQVVDAGGVLRGLEGVHARTPMRLHGTQLRQAPRRQRYPVAVQRRGAGRNRAALRGSDVPDLPGDLRGLRPRHRQTGATFIRGRVQGARTRRAARS